MPNSRAVFTTMLPIIEIDNGMAFLTVDEDGHRVCTTVHNFELFLEEARRKVVEWHARESAVVPFVPREPPTFRQEDHDGH